MGRFDNWKCRASGLGKIMTDAVGKTYAEQLKDEIKSRDSYANKITDFKLNPKKPELLDELIKGWEESREKIKILEPLKDKIRLSVGCKTYLKRVYVAEKYGRLDDIKSKYIEKGKMLQELGTTMYSRIRKQMFHTNKEKKENEFVKGEIDFQWFEKNCINDIKISWNIFTFWDNIEKVVDPMYDWQGQSYMWLWDKEEFRLNHILVNTPDKFIEDEKRYLLNEFVGTQEEYMEACMELERTMKFDDIPLEERLIETVIKRDEEKIKRIAPKVEACRDFLNNIKRINYEMEN